MSDTIIDVILRDDKLPYTPARTKIHLEPKRHNRHSACAIGFCMYKRVVSEGIR